MASTEAEGGLIPVMLAGGAGTRLWPLSRAALPKHLVPLLGSETLLQQTARRVLRVAAAEAVVTVGAGAQAVTTRMQLEAVHPDLCRHLLLEPVGRNTAAAVALAALYVRDRFAAASLLWVCPTDHAIGDVDALLAALARARPAARDGELATFGIRPGSAETGYGYIELGPALAGDGAVRRARRFVEKPARAVAEAMLAKGGHLWNSGMFLCRADRILDELAAHEQGLLEAVTRAYAECVGDPCRPPPELYKAVPAVPIDKAVMERSKRVAVVPCDPGWSDVGSWQALWERSARDASGNALEGPVVLEGSRDCLVQAEHRLVACAGVSGLAVVETRDAVLVADRRDGESVRRLVAALQAQGRPEAQAHAGETRPWGRFVVLHEGPGFKVKEIVVEPGGRLSLQSHRHRAEHWVVVAGTARVQIDDEVRVLGPNESVHIPLGARHRLDNPGEVPMHLIEVQCGAYLGEDDIVRYEDVYGRS